MADDEGAEVGRLGDVAARVGADAHRRIRALAAESGVDAPTLVTRWVLQRLEVEEAARAARGRGTDALLELLAAIEDVPDDPDA